VIFLKLFIALFLLYLWTKLLGSIRNNKARFQTFSANYLLLNLLDWFVWISVSTFYLFNMVFLVVGPEVSLDDFINRVVGCLAIAALVSPLLVLVGYAYDRFKKSREVPNS